MLGPRGWRSRRASQRRYREQLKRWLEPREKEPRRQHTVPHFYLSKWGDETGKLVWLDRMTGRRRSRAPKKATMHDDFYTVVLNSGEESYIVENMLATVEDRAAKAIDRVVRSPDAIDDPAVRDVLTAFIGFQMARGTEQRELFKRNLNWLMKFELRSLNDPDAMTERLKEEGIEPTAETVAEYLEVVKDVDDLRVSAHQNEAVMLMVSIAEGLMDCIYFKTRWHLVELPEMSLITTDEPVTKVRRPYGPNRYEVELLFPVDPSHLLNMTKDTEPTREKASVYPWLVNTHLATFAFKTVFGHPGYQRWDDLASHVMRNKPIEMRIIETDDMVVASTHPAGLPPHLRRLYRETPAEPSAVLRRGPEPVNP
jgi:hypothetical protein